MKTSTLVAVTAGTAVTGLLGKPNYLPLGFIFLDRVSCSISEVFITNIAKHLFLAYVVWFDYKRQSDPEFRRALKRDNRRIARAVREEVEAQGAMQREAIKKAVAQAKVEGFPADLEEREAYFMGQVAKGESICAEGMRLCLFE
jgi:hypothetical protein